MRAGDDGRGTQPDGVGCNGDPTQVQPIGVPAGLHGDRGLYGPARMLGAGGDQERERRIGKVHALTP
jgi:hypothetical protein